MQQTVLETAQQVCSRDLASARYRRDLLKAFYRRAKQEKADDWLRALPAAIDRERAQIRKMSSRHSYIKRRLVRNH